MTTPTPRELAERIVEADSQEAQVPGPTWSRCLAPRGATAPVQPERRLPLERALRRPCPTTGGRNLGWFRTGDGTGRSPHRAGRGLNLRTDNGRPSALNRSSPSPLWGSASTERAQPRLPRVATTTSDPTPQLTTNRPYPSRLLAGIRGRPPHREPPRRVRHLGGDQEGSGDRAMWRVSSGEPGVQQNERTSIPCRPARPTRAVASPHLPERGRAPQGRLPCRPRAARRIIAQISRPVRPARADGAARKAPSP